MPRLIALSILTAAVAMPVSQGSEPQPRDGHARTAAEPARIQKAPAPIIVDGILDEPTWKHAEVVEADYVWGQVGQRSAQPQMRARYTWDDHSSPTKPGGWFHKGAEHYPRYLLRAD